MCTVEKEQTDCAVVVGDTACKLFCHVSHGVLLQQPDEGIRTRSIVVVEGLIVVMFSTATWSSSSERNVSPQNSLAFSSRELDSSVRLPEVQNDSLSHVLESYVIWMEPSGILKRKASRSRKVVEAKSVAGEMNRWPEAVQNFTFAPVWSAESKYETSK